MRQVQTQELAKEINLHIPLLWLAVVMLFMAGASSTWMLRQDVHQLRELVKAQQKTIHSQNEVNSSLVAGMQRLTNINKQQLERVLELRDEPIEPVVSPVRKNTSREGRGGVSGRD